MFGFRFSFSSPSLDGYLECLEIWSALLDQMGAKLSSSHQEKTHQYMSVMELLIQAVLHKIQLRHNQVKLWINNSILNKI